MIKTAGVSQARFAVRVIHEGCPNFCVVAISREVCMKMNHSTQWCRPLLSNLTISLREFAYCWI